MKLGIVWNAQAAFAVLAALKKPPKVAYRLMKYERKLQREIDACEKQRVLLVYEAAGVEPGTPSVELKADTPEVVVFIEKFNAFLDTESDLEQVGLTMDELVASLDLGANTLSESDLAHLEPFFLADPEKEGA